MKVYNQYENRGSTQSMLRFLRERAKISKFESVDEARIGFWVIRLKILFILLADCSMTRVNIMKKLWSQREMTHSL